MHAACVSWCCCRGAQLLLGEPGLEKDSLAALVHFEGPGRDLPMVQLQGERMDARGGELFGRGNKPGLLTLLEEQGGGSILINDVHKVGGARGQAGGGVLEILFRL